MDTTSIIKTGNINLVPTGLTITRDISFDEWVDLMQTLVRLETAFQFAIGDALIYGETAYGEKYSQAMDATGLSYQSLANMVWVCRKVPMQNRRDDISWTHHRVVASVDTEDQPGLLDMAKSQGMSASDLMHHISGKPERQRSLVSLPSGVTVQEATQLLEQYAEAVTLARSGAAPENETADDATLLSCVLCSQCPYRSGK